MGALGISRNGDYGLYQLGPLILPGPITVTGQSFVYEQNK